MGVKVVRKPGRKDWYIQVCEGGRRYLRHVGSREAAYASKKDIEEALATGAFVPPKERGAAKGISFRDAIGRWKKEHVEVRLKPSSKRYYGSIIDGWLLPAFGDKALDEIARADVKAAVARWKEDREKVPPEEAAPALGERKRTRKLKPGKGIRSIPNALRALRSFFSWAIEEELVSSNPVKDPSKIFKLDSPFRGDYLRSEEVPAYLDGVRMKTPRYLVLFRTMIFTGPRIGEAIGLEWGDIDWRGKFLTFQRSSWQGHVTSPKTTSSIRQVQLSPEMIAVLKEHRRAIAAESLEAGRSMPERVFVNEVGNPLDEAKVSKAHHSALKVAGLRSIRIHDLRGTFASLLVSAGVPLFHVAKALGHSSQETTMRHYAHLAPGAAKEMPNILERYVFGDPAGRDANGMRTAASAVEGLKSGGV
ncbi:MAG: tyrosine-type recombinase/integrase [Actinomycetota bacterium]